MQILAQKLLRQNLVPTQKVLGKIRGNFFPKNIAEKVFFFNYKENSSKIIFRGKYCIHVTQQSVSVLAQMSASVRSAINELSAKHRRDHCGLVDIF
jgi:hypothetical protein